MNTPPLSLRFRVRSAFQQLRVEAPSGHSLEQLCLPAWWVTTSVIVRVLIWSCAETSAWLHVWFGASWSRGTYTTQTLCDRSLQHLHELPLLIPEYIFINIHVYKFSVWWCQFVEAGSCFHGSTAPLAKLEWLRATMQVEIRPVRCTMRTTSSMCELQVRSLVIFC